MLGTMISTVHADYLRQTGLRQELTLKRDDLAQHTPKQITKTNARCSSLCKATSVNHQSTTLHPDHHHA